MASIYKRAIPAILATALLHGFSGGLHPLWPLAWLAPLPILWFAAEAPAWAAGGAGFFGWFAGGFTMWGYFHGTLHMPAPLAVALFALAALIPALVAALFSALLRRHAPWLALLGAPALWVTAEYANSLTSPHGTYGSLAYTQLDFLPALQLASLAGPWGITFLLVLASAALAIGIARRAWRVMGTGLAVTVLALVFGAVRLSQPQGGEPVKVGLIASDLKENQGVVDPGEPAARLFADYAREAAGLAQQGVQVVVLPENMAVVVAPGADQALQDFADSSGVQLLAGMLRVDTGTGKKYNEARLYSPRAPVIAYDKQHLLPPFESPITPGAQLALLQKTAGLWGVAICKDMDFTAPASLYGSAGAGLLLVPAWDFVEDAWAHGHIAIMRAVEGGFSLVRAARGGYLTVTDDRGRVLAETTSWSAPYASLVATVPSGHETTLYLRLGDWLAWLSIALVALSVGRLVLHRPGTDRA
ncbi:MAG TPA: nitrilase-related carbon-nitrogen hydrolase [Magnetospirillaceae bacterium]|nr:nitrilase-related carbon-nitrogen hydrolase [Magnetospirillaceae bacterium]